ncbi:MAG TPA: LysR family transcriptional regulator, partial [Alphaproteobacteria bacterium]|nr:LysR family transcriptional regulator [Alphaproteobacteria bacterium]
MAKPTLRIDLEGGGAIGPGKARLLELIRETGSLAAAARGLRMSYRRAWLLVNSLEQSFGLDMTRAQAGGRSGGRTELTEAGHAILATYRAAERACLRATAKPLAALDALVRSEPQRNQ